MAHTSSSTPGAVNGLSGVISICGGSVHTLALKSDGTVWAWGYNGDGELGNGTYTTSAPYGSSTPVQVSGISSVIAIAGGAYHTVALAKGDTERPRNQIRKVQSTA
jgi:alpha-tubulin suppressor-like RCC1 family protein